MLPSLNKGFIYLFIYTTRGFYNKACYNQGFLQSGVLELGESDDGDDFNECSNLEVYWDELDDWYNLEDWADINKWDDI